MPDKVYLDDQGNPISGKVYLDDNGEPIKGTPKSARIDSIKTGAREGFGDLKDMAGALLPTKQDLESGSPFGVLGGVSRMVTGMGSQLLEGAKAIPDVARNLANRETRDATVKGFTEGAVEGGTGMTVDAAKKDPWRAGARFVTNTVVPAVVLKKAPAGVRSVLGKRTDVPKPPPGVRLVKNPTEEILKDLRETIDAAKKDARMPGPSEGVTVSSTTPPANLAQPAVSYPRVPRLVTGKKKGAAPSPKAETPPVKADAPEAPAQPTAAGSGPEPAPPGREGHFKLPEPRAKLTDAQFADVDRRINGKFRTDGGPERRGVPKAAEPPPPAPKEPGIPAVSKDGQKVVVRPKKGVVSGLRNAVGAEKAARELGITPADVRKAAPGPSRRPYAVDLADDDANYRRRIADERGFVGAGPAVKVGLPVAGGVAGYAAANDDSKLAGALAGILGGAAVANPTAAAKRFNELRMIGMLSGGALPKSILGNVGAHLNAAGELGSLKPIKEMLRVPTNLKNAKAGWKAQTSPGGGSGMTSGAKVEGLGRLNVPGRVMGAMDDSTQASLVRSGVDPQRAKQLTLMEDNPAGYGANALQRAFDSRIGRFLVPFQRVPLNQFAQGAEALDGLLPKGKNAPTIHNSRRGRAMTTGAIGAGAVAGDETQNPLKLAMLTALFGSRGMPFALGAGGAIAAKHGGSKAKSVLDRVGVGLPEGSMSDVFQPWRAIDKPALIRFLEQLKGEGE